MAKSRSLPQFVQTEAAAVGRAARAVWSGPGRERDLALQSGKAALAAVLAWLLASRLLPDSVALMAPWVALVLVQATVYRSMAHGAQQLAAIALGTVLAYAALALLGHPAAAMAVVLPVTMLLGNWPRLGTQGIYSATSALFTVTAGEASAAAAGDRLLASLLGAGIGIGVNALLRPPAYLRDSHKAVRGAVEEAADTLREIADGLQEPWEYDRALGWYDRARRLPRRIRDVRSSVEWSRESMWLNPEWRRRAELHRFAPSYDETLHTLDHVADHLSGLTRTLLEAVDEEGAGLRPEGVVTRPYADFLRRIGSALDAYGRLVTEPGGAEESRKNLDEAVAEVRAVHDELRAELPRWATGSPEAVALFGSLLLEARRLTGRLLPGERGEEGREGARSR